MFEAASKLDRQLEPVPNNNVKMTRTMSWISVFTLIRTDTTLDLSQKAEKVCFNVVTLQYINKYCPRRIIKSNQISLLPSSPADELTFLIGL